MDRFYLEINSTSENESFARMVVSAFVLRLNPTVEEIEDIKTAVSEAVTNAIIHGYGEGYIGSEKIVYLECVIDENVLTVEVRDKGKGIQNIDQAMKPFFTTLKEEERSGMGFSFMEIFMDEVKVESLLGKGTRVVMKKKISIDNNR